MEVDKAKHLEFIQNVITRMNSNSFMIKGWAITIASAVLAVFASTDISNILLIGVLPTALFWFLDAFYLRQERLFRCLYGKAILTNSEVPEYSMKIPQNCFSVKKNKYCKVFFSRTIWPIYTCIIIISLAGFLYFNFFHTPSQCQKTLPIQVNDTIKVSNVTPHVNITDTTKKR